MVDAEAAALRAVEIAAREIERLGEKEALTGDFDATDLARYARICLDYEHHKLTWMQRLDPGKLPEELLRRVTKELGAQDGQPGHRARRASAG